MQPVRVVDRGSLPNTSNIVSVDDHTCPPTNEVVSAPISTHVEINDIQLGKGQRVHTKSTKLNDYILYTTRPDTDPSYYTPASASTIEGYGLLSDLELYNV